jgi:hypothetical protein
VGWQRKPGRFGGSLTAGRPAGIIKFYGPRVRSLPAPAEAPERLPPTVDGSMSIWNKVLVGLILVASLAFFYLAMRTLQTHKHWRELVRDHIEGTGEGPAYRPGIDWYRTNAEELQEQIEAKTLELRILLAQRGRVWANCRPRVDAGTKQTGLVAVDTSGRGIAEKTVLYVFDESHVQQGGRYVGEFKVATLEVLDGNGNGALEQAECPPAFRQFFPAADRNGDGTLDPEEFSAAKAKYPGPEMLKPALAMTQEELDRLVGAVAADTSWRMYETMPADSHEALARIDPEQRKELLPADGADEYLKDGQLLSAEEVKAMGLQGRLIALDKDGRVMYADQDGKTLYSAGVDDRGRLLYVDSEGTFAYAAAVQKQGDASGEVTYEVQYLDQQGQVLPGVSVAEKQVGEGKGRYLRPLRDYGVLLKQAQLQRARLLRLIENASEDRAYVETALTEAKKQLGFRQTEQARLTADYRMFQDQGKVVAELLEGLKRDLKSCREAIDRLISENMAAAAQLDQFQQDALRQIEARSGSVAQSGTGEAG